MARIFHQRPSQILDPDNHFGKLFALQYDIFCSGIAWEMITEGKLV